MVLVRVCLTMKPDDLFSMFLVESPEIWRRKKQNLTNRRLGRGPGPMGPMTNRRLGRGPGPMGPIGPYIIGSYLGPFLAALFCSAVERGNMSFPWVSVCASLQRLCVRRGLA